MARQSSPLFSCRSVSWRCRAARAWAQPFLQPFITGAVAVACVLIACDAFGCPNCKDAVNTSDPDGLNVARGYFYSILIMLAMPCTLISSFGIYVWREMQRQKRAGLTSAEEGLGGYPIDGTPGAPSHEPITPRQP